MILKRFNTENNHIDYINYKSNNMNNNNENKNIILESKIELLANISKNWNNELKKEYSNIKSLYKYNVAELKEIKEEYILKNKKNDVNEKKKTSINKEVNMDFKTKNIVVSSIYDSVAELQMKYGENDAIKEIYINENKIYIDLLCDTDITQSVVNYNGYEIVYNKICKLSNESNEVEYNLQDKLVEQSIFMYKNLFN
jgi:molybdopterin-binding protein